MFGYRRDGKKAKDLQPFFYVIPHVMKTRCDSQVYFKTDIPLEPLDAYINKKAEEGIKLSYMNVIYAALVKLLAERPHLNRFVMNGKIYDRNQIYMSLAIKKNLTDDGQETTIKLPFTGKENIFEIKFSFEQYVKDNVILKFSNKQGGAYNVFSYHWQCFVWAAVVGFIHNERRPLQSPIADRPFSLNTMCNGGGERDAEALLCMCIAKAGSLDIMKEPAKAIDLINEYANGGFYYIMKMMQDQSITNDLEWVKQEIFMR